MKLPLGQTCTVCYQSSHHQLPACAGAGMFIGSVVAGAVLWTSSGAKMRGALIRDVAAYAASVAFVLSILASGKVTADTFFHLHNFTGVTPFCSCSPT